MRTIDVVLIQLVAVLAPVALEACQIIDKDPAGGIEKVAGDVCNVSNGLDKQIGKASTCSDLVQYFQGLPPDHELADCWQRSQPALEELKKVMETDNDNVCSENKIQLIEQYHHRYVSEVNKQQAGEAPHLIKLSFMNYASKISTICEKSASQTVAKEADSCKDKMPADGQLVKQATNLMGVPDLPHGYDNLFLMWGLVDKLPLSNSKYGKYLRSQDPHARAIMSLHDISKITKVQETCATQIRPHYAPHLLPVLRLVDLGYYPEDDSLLKVILDLPIVRDLLGTTQLCEAILPIRFKADTSLGPDDLVMLDETHISEASSWIEVETVSAENPCDLDTLILVDEQDGEIITERVLGQVKKRDDTLLNAVLNMLDGLKAVPKLLDSLLLNENGGLLSRVGDTLADLTDLSKPLKALGLRRKKRAALTNLLDGVGKFAVGGVEQVGVLLSSTLAGVVKLLGNVL